MLHPDYGTTRERTRYRGITWETYETTTQQYLSICKFYMMRVPLLSPSLETLCRLLFRASEYAYMWFPYVFVVELLSACSDAVAAAAKRLGSQICYIELCYKDKCSLNCCAVFFSLTFHVPP